MRTIINIYTVIGVLALLSISQPASAQQKIDPTLEVRRDFDAYLLEIQKGRIKPEYPDSLGNFNLNFDYSIFDKPIANLYEFSPLPSAQIERGAKSRYPMLYGNFGVNIPLNPHVDIYFQPTLPSNFTLTLYGKHDSFWGDLNRIKLEGAEALKSERLTKAPYSKNNLGINAGHSFEKGEIGLNLEYDRNFFSFYGFNDSTYQINNVFIAPDARWGTASYLKDTLSHSFDRLGANLYLRSTNKKSNHFYYDFNLKYKYINDNVKYLEILDADQNYYNPFYSNEENYVDAKATLGPVFAKHHRFLIDLEYQAANSINSQKLDRYNVDVYPRYLFNKNKWIFEVGLKLGKYVDKSEDAFSVYFRGSLSYELSREKLWFYASVDGNNQFRTYSQMMDLNPWITPSISVRNTREPLIARAGFKGEVRERLSYNVWAGYNEYKGYLTMFHFTDNMYGPVNTFIASYKDMNKISAGGEVFWKSDAVESGVSMIYSKCENKDGSTVFNIPAFETRAFGRYNWRERIIAGVTIHYRSSGKTLAYYDRNDAMNEESSVTIPAFTVVNLDLTYAYNRNLSFYLRVNNLLNTNDLYYLNYGNPGIGGGLGVVFKF